MPLIAVAAANCVNIPMMRSQEIQNGIGISLTDGTEVGKSGNAAVAAISQVIPSRVAMAAPAMFLTPVVMAFAEKTAFVIKNPWVKAPATVFLTGLALTFSTPLACALFKQQAAIDFQDLEPHLQQRLAKEHPTAKNFYYNKGL